MNTIIEISQRLTTFVLCAAVAGSLYIPISAQAGATLKDINFDGVNQTNACGTCSPPDTHGAIGTTQFVQIVNRRVLVYAKTPVAGTTAPTLLKSSSLASFFGYTAQPLFDPRIVYDSTANRWVITAEAMPESATVQRQFIAVSRTADATGAFFVRNIDVNIRNNSDFWDYPQLGISENAILITANIFQSPPPNPGPFLHSTLISIAKAPFYNNGTLSFRRFTGLSASSLAPPIVVGPSNGNTYLISAPSSGSVLKLYTLQNAGTNDVLTGPIDIAVKPYVVPPSASQPGTTVKLDTLNSRFVNASLQKGDALWQIHTVSGGGLPTPRYYLIDLGQKNVAWSNLFYASPTSNDFNASVTATPGGIGLVTWSSTDTNTMPQVRFAAQDVFGPFITVFYGSPAYTSPTFYAPTGAVVARWGDYSAITIDPSDTSKAWGTNQTVNSQTVWGSRIFKIGVP